MQLYIDCAAEIYAVFLKYIAPEDIHVYSIDESFPDVTPYLAMYKMTAKEIAVMIIKDVKDTVGTICTCGIGTNLHLAKIALDTKAYYSNSKYRQRCGCCECKQETWSCCSINNLKYL